MGKVLEILTFIGNVESTRVKESKQGAGSKEHRAGSVKTEDR
jgi:hypothetical protein